MASLRASLTDGRSRATDHWLSGRSALVRLNDLATGTCFDTDIAAVANRAVMLATRDQFAAALALIELDGVAKRVVLATPDLSDAQVAELASRADTDVVVTDGARRVDTRRFRLHVRALTHLVQRASLTAPRCETEWVLLTSATGGAPKPVVHTLATLTGAIQRAPAPARPVVWGTFYDIRRYGGLQIFLRSVVGGASLVVGDSDEPLSDYLARLATCGVTHLSGTPSHWRRVLMSRRADAIAPRSIRLSGEIADQTLLDTLTRQYPHARVSHAFASTEAGVAFEIEDGRAGFPETLLDTAGEVTVKVVDGTLRIRSSRIARQYIGDPTPIAGADGFVDTGDTVELRAGRYSFVGRRSGAINVGGLKVFPEEIEAAINRHPAVRMSRVRAKRSPIIGAVVAADVVLDETADRSHCAEEILAACRHLLPPHKVPATIHIVPALEVAVAGKLLRHA